MMRKTSIILFIGFLICIIQASAQDAGSEYLNETPHGITPKVFAPGRVSKDSVLEFGAIFSSNHREFYYAVFKNGKAETRVMKYQNGSWSKPSKLLTHNEYSFNDPFLTPDNKRLFFISDRPLSGSGPKKDYDIWYIERQPGGWSEPRNAGPNINSNKNEYYISFTKTGKMYFSSNVKDQLQQENYDIYASDWKDGKFQPAIALSTMINTSSYEADVFVAPDESYVVFATNRPGGLGSGDLHVSFRNQDGTWTLSRSLGNTINTDTDDFCPYVTKDGKYLFYASRGDIYWVSTEVINALR